MFTDIVDSTMHATQLGDRRWKELIGRHHAIIRRELKRFGGRELDTAGDGFFASFGEPAAAIRCACAAAEAVRQLGIEIRAGVHFGECEQVGGKLGGLTVVIGARVMSLGGAGEVLTTASTRELVGGAELGFADRGLHALKGIEAEVHLFEVTDVDGTPRPGPIHAQESEQRLATVQPVGHRRPTPRKWVAIAAALLLTILVAVPWAARRAEGSSEIAPNSIGVLDPETGEVTATVGLEDRPGSIAASADAVWVTSPDVGTVTRIDADDQEIRDTIPVGENPSGIAVGEGGVWVVNSDGPSVSRISPDTDQVVKTITGVGNGPTGIAVGEGAVWVTNRFDGTVSRIEPGTNEIEEIPVGGLDPRGIAVGFGDVWVALTGSNQVVRVDANTNSITQAINVGNAPGLLAVSADAVWVVNTLDDTVSKIDPDTNSVVDTIGVGDGPAGITVAQGTVWVANESDGTLSGIEPAQASTSSLVIRSVPQGLVGVGTDLWISVRGTATSHRGGTLRPVSRNEVGTLDPTVAYSVWDLAALHLIGDGLVAFEPTGGTSGKLVQDLATAVPTPTNSGRRYTFTLRSRIRYSDGEFVTAVDFLSAIERGFRLKASRGNYEYFFSELVGAEACLNEPDHCDLSAGIVTDEASGAVTFNLVAPDPEFLYKLTLPFAYPVPPSVPEEEQATTGIPGTGPYMLESPLTEEGLTLVRNPYFRVWSPAARPDGYADRIEWTLGVDPQAQVEAVSAGDADLAMNVDESGELDEIFVGFAAQVHTTPNPLTIYAVINTQVPPFDNIDVRRAINFAVDKDRVVEILGGGEAARASCQQLPPNFPGYEPYCPYTMNPGPEGSWFAPNLEEAKRLVRRSGTRNMDVVIEVVPWMSDAQADPLGDYLIEVLGELGYRGRVLPREDAVFYGRSTKFQVAVDAWAADYPAASNFIVPFLACDSRWVPSAGFCDPEIDAMIRRATQMQGDDPAAAGALWAEIDHAIVDQAPFLPLVSTIGVGFVSERVGNYQVSPQWGVLLDLLWVQ